MAVGPSWYGQYLFNSAFKTPSGEIAAAAPLTWDGESTTATGNVGGGIWMVSSHSKNLKAATALATWLTTSDREPPGRADLPGVRLRRQGVAGQPGEQGLLRRRRLQRLPRRRQRGVDRLVEHQVQRRHPLVERGAAGADGGQVADLDLPAWQTAIANEAKSVGYTVVTQ
jgi:hypothetical protein